MCVCLLPVRAKAKIKGQRGPAVVRGQEEGEEDKRYSSSEEETDEERGLEDDGTVFAGLDRAKVARQTSYENRMKARKAIDNVRQKFSSMRGTAVRKGKENEGNASPKKGKGGEMFRAVLSLLKSKKGAEGEGGGTWEEFDAILSP